MEFGYIPIAYLTLSLIAVPLYWFTNPETRTPIEAIVVWFLPFLGFAFLTCQLSAFIRGFMCQKVWLLELCQDPENHPFEMTTLGIFEEVNSTDLVGWVETSTDVWVKHTSDGEYFFKRLLTQKSPSWMGVCNSRTDTK